MRSRSCTPLGFGVPSLLPPCRVCGAEAVGKHYGVISCQRCRSFFGRMLVSPADVRKCKRNKSCDLQVINSRCQSCVACRYKACLSAGMKKVKKCGRYSHADRTDYTEEVQNLLATNTTPHTTPHTTPYATPPTTPPTTPHTRPYTTPPTTPPTGPHTTPPTTPHTTLYATPDTTPYATLPTTPHTSPQQRTNVPYQQASVLGHMGYINVEPSMNDGNKIPNSFGNKAGNNEMLKVETMNYASEGRHHPNDERRGRELDAIIDFLTVVHLRIAPHEGQFFATIKDRELRYKEITELKIKMFGPMKPLPYRDYFKIYKSTGVDIDGRKALIEKIIPSLEKCIHRFINFIKHIPGFSKLHVDDQIQLLKGSVFECDLLSSYIVYNHDLPAFIDPDNPQLIVSLFELGMLYDYEKLHLFAECAHILQKLDLVPEEQAMLYAYMVLTSDSSLSPMGQSILAVMRDTIEDCLLRVISKHHDNPNQFLRRLISTILDLKAVQRLWCTEYGEVIRDYADINWPPIVQNIMMNP